MTNFVDPVSEPGEYQRMLLALLSDFGLHRERGPESYELTFRLLAGHDRCHLAQAARTLEQVHPGR